MSLFITIFHAWFDNFNEFAQLHKISKETDAHIIAQYAINSQKNFIKKIIHSEGVTTIWQLQCKLFHYLKMEQTIEQSVNHPMTLNKMENMDIILNDFVQEYREIVLTRSASNITCYMDVENVKTWLLDLLSRITETLAFNQQL